MQVRDSHGFIALIIEVTGIDFKRKSNQDFEEKTILNSHALANAYVLRQKLIYNFR